METITIKVGKVFFTDHLKRGCVEDEYSVVETKKHYTLTLSVRDFIDLVSDANYYHDHTDHEFGIRAGARGVLMALRKQFTYGEVEKIAEKAGRVGMMRELEGW